MYGDLPYSDLLIVRSLDKPELKRGTVFHPGRASEFPIDTLITSINAYHGLVFLKSREQFWRVYGFNNGFQFKHQPEATYNLKSVL